METSTWNESALALMYNTRPAEENVTGFGSPASIKSSQSLIVITVPAIMFACGVLSNILALVVLYRSKKNHKHTVFYKLVGGLACTDLFGTAVTSPVTIMVYNNGLKWVGGQPMCDYFSFMMIFAGMATVLIVGVMAIERYVSIIHPYAYEAKFSSEKVIYILIGVWAIAAVIACCPFLGLGTNVIQYPGTWCFFLCFGEKLTDKLFTYFYASVGLLVILLTAICNASVMCVLARMRNKQGKFAQPTQRGQLDNEVQMMVLLAGIILVFATCYAPLMVRVIINQTGQFPVNHSMDLWAIRLACLNQILDPWVYILFRKELFTRIWRLVYCVTCHKGRQTAPSAILKTANQNANSQPVMSKHGEDDVFVNDCDVNAKTALKMRLLLDFDCCSAGKEKKERKESTRALLIPMKSYHRYGTRSTSQCSPSMESSMNMNASPQYDVVIVQSPP